MLSCIMFGSFTTLCMKVLMYTRKENQQYNKIKTFSLVSDIDFEILLFF